MCHYSKTQIRKDGYREEYLPVTPQHIWDIPDARHKKKILGRGRSSNHGKTCGRGHKGQNSRAGTGKIRPSFVGGQNPLNKRLPKKGSNPRGFQEPLTTVTIGKIVYLIRKGRLDATQPITMKSLFQSGAFTDTKYGVKILGNGLDDLKHIEGSLHFEVTDASQSVIDAVKEKGGSVTSVYHTETTLRRYLKPWQFKNPEARIPMPYPRKLKKLEEKRNKGMEVVYPRVPWFEEYKAEQEEFMVQEAQREKTPGEKILPQYPADRSPGVSLDKPKYEKEQLVRHIKVPIP